MFFFKNSKIQKRFFFKNSKIKNVFFKNSKIKNVFFKNSKIKNVFFSKIQKFKKVFCVCWIRGMRWKTKWFQRTKLDSPSLNTILAGDVLSNSLVVRNIFSFLFLQLWYQKSSERATTLFLWRLRRSVCLANWSVATGKESSYVLKPILHDTTPFPPPLQCSVSCGGGVSKRGVYCLHQRTQRRLRPAYCKANLRPESSSSCNPEPCGRLNEVFDRARWPRLPKCPMIMRRFPQEISNSPVGHSTKHSFLSKSPSPPPTYVCLFHISVMSSGRDASFRSVHGLFRAKSDRHAPVTEEALFSFLFLKTKAPCLFFCSLFSPSVKESLHITHITAFLDTCIFALVFFLHFFFAFLCRFSSLLLGWSIN